MTVKTIAPASGDGSVYSLSLHTFGRMNLGRAARNAEQCIRAITAKAWPSCNDLNLTKLLQSRQVAVTADYGKWCIQKAHRRFLGDRM